MLASLARLLDRQSIAVEGVTDVMAPYPDHDCLRQIMDAVSGGSLAILCMSNFVSSPCANSESFSDLFSLQPGSQFGEIPARDCNLLEWNQGADLEENATRYAKATAELLADLAIRDKLLLASELKQRGAAARAFTGLLYPGLELCLQWNRVRFYSPRGSYWHSLRSSSQSPDPDWATGFWSLAHWGAGTTALAAGTPDSLLSRRI